MELPLVEREFARSGKRIRTYAIRLIPVSLSCFLIHMVLLSSLGRGGSIEVAETVGEGLAGVCFGFQFVIAWVLPFLYGAGAIAQEKQERTLELLLIADFRGWDIVLAKFLSAFLQTELLILSPLPVLAMASFLGGVSVPLVAIRVLLLSAIAFACTSVGLLCSTLSRRSGEALLYAIGAVTAWLGLTELFDELPQFSFPPTSIASAAGVVSDSMLNPGFWMPSLAITAILGAIALLATVCLLPRQAQERVVRKKTQRAAASVLTRPLFPRAHRDPAVGIVKAGLEEHTWLLGSGAGRLAVAILMGVITGVIPCLGPFVAAGAMLYVIAGSITGMYRSTMLDDILVTPIEDVPLAKAIGRALLDKSLPFFPALLIADLYVLGYLAMATFEMGTATHTSIFLLLLFMLIAGIGIYISLAVVQFRFLVALGCFASTLKMSPAAQTIVSMLIVIVMHLVFLVSTSILSVLVATVGFGSKADERLILAFAALAITALAAGVYWVAGYVFAKMFEHDLSFALRGARSLWMQVPQGDSAS